MTSLNGFWDFGFVGELEEYKGIEEFRNKKVFMFSDIQKLIAAMGALFFFAVFVSEFSPLVVRIFEKVVALFNTKGGI